MGLSHFYDMTCHFVNQVCTDYSRPVSKALKDFGDLFRLVKNQLTPYFCKTIFSFSKEFFKLTGGGAIILQNLKFFVHSFGLRHRIGNGEPKQ